MKHITRSAVVGAVVIATLIAFGAFASAQGPNKCLAAKNKCASKKMQGLLKCHSKAEKIGAAVDGTCTQKAKDKFDGGLTPAKGCFAKLEAKTPPPCLTTSDTGALELKVDAFVQDVLCELGYTTQPAPCPPTPTPTPTATLTPTPTPTAT